MPETIPHIPPDSTPEELYKSDRAMQRFFAAQANSRHEQVSRLSFLFDCKPLKDQFLAQPNATPIAGGPMFGAWLEGIGQAVDAHRDGKLDSNELASRLHRAFRYIGNYTVLTALSEERELETIVQAYDGFVMIPEFGRIRYPDPAARAKVQSNGVISLKSNEHHVIFDPREADQPDWEPLRYIGPPDCRIPLNDLDPHRDIFRYPVAERLSPDMHRKWDEAFQRAFAFIQTHDPSLAELTRAHLLSVVPVPEEPFARGKSMSHSAVLGVTSTNQTQDHVRLAGHIAFGLRKQMILALRANYPQLYRDGDDPLANKAVYSPNRESYAVAPHLLDDSFINIEFADFFCKLARDPALRDYAQFSFECWHSETLQNLQALEASGYATPDAERLVHYMHRELAELEPFAPSIPEHIKKAIERHAVDRRLSWRLHVVQPDPQAIISLAAAWRNNQLCPQIVVENTLDTRTDAFIHLGARNRYVLQEVQLKEPRIFEAFRRGEPQEALLGQPTPGDIQYIRGEVREARHYFRSAIHIQPRNPEPWAGFALTFKDQQDLAARALIDQPELVAATYAALDDPRLEPEDVAAWLAGRARSAIPPDCSLP